MQFKSLFLLIIVLVTAHTAFGKAERASIISYNGHRYDVYKVYYTSGNIKLYWKDGKGRKLKSLGSLDKMIRNDGHKLLFATNGGMYTPDNAPQGLYVEKGKEYVPIDINTHKQGNFYLQPNGVFLLDGVTAKVVPTTEYGKSNDGILYATQSGPMLVVAGKINPLFTRGSTNIYVRSGVGIGTDGQVVFAISEDEVNFFDFATLFRDLLHCSNALYLDGAVSQMYLPALHRFDRTGSFGAMIGVVE